MPDKIRICTVVIGTSQQEFLRNLENTQKVSGFVELRVDYVEDIDKASLAEIKTATRKENILTCRDPRQNGKFQDGEEKRVELLQEAINIGFGHIDIELSTLEKHSFARKKGVQIIASYHNFEETPSYNELWGIVARMNRVDADIIKIAVKSKSETDNKKLFRLLLDNATEKEMIVLGMGEAGRMTRILSPLLGGYLTFASLGEQSSAKGQIDLQEMHSIYKTLGVSA